MQVRATRRTWAYCRSFSRSALASFRTESANSWTFFHQRQLGCGQQNIAGGLGIGDMIKRIEKRILSRTMPHELERAIRHNLVDIHIDRRATRAFERINNERVGMGPGCQLKACRCDGVALFLGQLAVFYVDLGDRHLGPGKPRDQAGIVGQSLAAIAEILDNRAENGCQTRHQRASFVPRGYRFQSVAFASSHLLNFCPDCIGPVPLPIRHSSICNASRAPRMPQCPLSPAQRYRRRRPRCHHN